MRLVARPDVGEFAPIPLSTSILYPVTMCCSTWKPVFGRRPLSSCRCQKNC